MDDSSVSGDPSAELLSKVVVHLAKPAILSRFTAYKGTGLPDPSPPLPSPPGVPLKGR